MQELIKSKNVKVCDYLFPSSGDTVYREWKRFFEQILSEELILSSNTNLILIGHSLGAMFLQKYFSIVNEISINFNKSNLYLHLVTCGIEEGDFSIEKEEWNYINSLGINCSVYQSKDDPVIPYSEYIQISSCLPFCSKYTFESLGHFNCETFPKLIENINLQIKN